MAKTKLLGKDKERQLAEQKKVAKKKNRKKFSLIGFFKGVWSEVKKVTWPSRKDLFKTTFAVIIFIVVFTVIVGLIDYGMGTIFSNFLQS
ncbi:MAG: preprotein translocase subunit SecE [Clostridia bacterium]|nr:preprotein translocase subunit SecE [Clostridia bacterium]